MLEFNGRKVYLTTTKYLVSDSLYVGFLDEDGEHYGAITMNLEDFPVRGNKAFVNIEKYGEKKITDFLVNNNIAKPTSRLGYSGFNVYQEFEFNMEEIQKYEFRE